MSLYKTIELIDDWRATVTIMKTCDYILLMDHYMANAHLLCKESLSIVRVIDFFEQALSIK
jgi:hypothetical protein